MSNALRGLAEVQSTMLITDLNRDKIISAMSEIKKLQAENEKLKVLNSTQENLLKACIKWMDGKGCPVPYDLRVALETPSEGE